MDYFSQETERLVLRKLTEDDIETWAEFFVANPDGCFVAVDFSLDKISLVSNSEGQLSNSTCWRSVATIH